MNTHPVQLSSEQLQTLGALGRLVNAGSIGKHQLLSIDVLRDLSELSEEQRLELMWGSDNIEGDIYDGLSAFFNMHA